MIASRSLDLGLRLAWCEFGSSAIHLFGGSQSLIPAAIPVAVSSAASATAASALPPAATSATALFGPVAALAVDGPIPAGFEGYSRRLPAAGADHGGACT